MLSALFSVIIEPLIYIVELAYALSYKVLQNPGLAIVCVSVVVNFLCLPLYSMADAQQQAERDKQKSMERWVNHIKEHFKGDEQYMMLSTYYRQQHYSQLSQLTGSVSLLLQILVFMAAYGYLSGLAVLKGSPFLMISDLGSLDAMRTLRGMAVNVLPPVMTELNLVSSALYTRRLPLKDMVQLESDPTDPDERLGFLSRVKFTFKRGNYARLRELIDAINDLD
jgi:membrane protein insertase Oxa1/YidC/SpoIIIJ